MGTVKITPGKQQLIGVRVQTVERKAASHTLRLLGKVAADETRVYTINATVDGWITKALPNTTGSFVKNNEILAVFYSPEFVAAAQGLFVALSAADRTKPSSKGTPLQMDQLAGFKLNIQQYLDSLKNLGMSDLQIERMTKTREWYQNVDLVSPADGLILARNVSNGLRLPKARSCTASPICAGCGYWRTFTEMKPNTSNPGLRQKSPSPTGECLPG